MTIIIIIRRRLERYDIKCEMRGIRKTTGRKGSYSKSMIGVLFSDEHAISEIACSSFVTLAIYEKPSPR
jgi:hypothetical protein